jgi:propionyl-CoA carboxylase beta chain
MHSSRAGTAHYLAADEQDAFAYTRTLIGYLPHRGERLPG